MPSNQLENNSQKIEKLKEIIKRSDLKNASGLASVLKIKPGYISEIMNGKKMVPKIMGQKLEDILQVNRKWFDYVINETDSNIMVPPMYLYNSNHDKLPQLQSIIESANAVDLHDLSLKIGIPEDRLYLFSKQQKTPSLEEYNLLVDHFEKEYLKSRLDLNENISKGIRPPKIKNNEDEVPYLENMNAAAGLNFLTDNSNPPTSFIKIPGAGVDVYINVFGDSMYPKYSSGDIIGIKYIDKDMVFFGNAFVIEMTDGEAYIKYIFPGKDEDHWELRSENPKFPAKQFHLEKISKVYNIKTSITKKSL